MAGWNKRETERVKGGAAATDTQSLSRLITRSETENLNLVILTFVLRIYCWDYACPACSS